jgi:hypothetical protein
MDVGRVCTYIALNSERELMGLLRKIFRIWEKDFLPAGGGVERYFTIYGG